ncbi:hypothetical protein M0R45_036311 [Rubus argutus]|uniref:Uncharacterized protein n=1 Tax=Rubus argutus TaxID=59490 RepID=A0AAW1VVQ9_RUBAR
MVLRRRAHGDEVHDDVKRRCWGRGDGGDAGSAEVREDEALMRRGGEGRGARVEHGQRRLVWAWGRTAAWMDAHDLRGSDWALIVAASWWGGSLRPRGGADRCGLVVARIVAASWWRGVARKTRRCWTELKSSELSGFFTFHFSLPQFLLFILVWFSRSHLLFLFLFSCLCVLAFLLYSVCCFDGIDGVVR